MERALELEEEQELQVSITFDELQCFDCQDVSTCVSQQTAIKICNKSLEDLSAKTVEVLSLWLRKLLRAYINEAECCIDIFKCLYEWFLRLVSVAPNWSNCLNLPRSVAERRCDTREQSCLQRFYTTAE